MGRVSQVICLSMPPEMTGQIDRLAKIENRTRSELLREAVRHYLEEKEWKGLFTYGRKQAAGAGITSTMIEEIIDENRR